MHATRALLRKRVFEPDRSNRRVHRDAGAVPVALAGLTPRQRRVPEHLRPALKITADVEEHVPVELVGREGHRQLGGAHDEFPVNVNETRRRFSLIASSRGDETRFEMKGRDAPSGADAALRVPPHAVRAADLERLVRG